MVLRVRRHNGYFLFVCQPGTSAGQEGGQEQEGQCIPAAERLRRCYVFFHGRLSMAFRGPVLFYIVRFFLNLMFGSVGLLQEIRRVVTLFFAETD